MRWSAIDNGSNEHSRNQLSAGWQRAREPVRLDQGKAEQIIAALNTDLANSNVLHHQLRKHH